MNLRCIPLAFVSVALASCATGPGDFREVPASQAHATLKPGRVVKMILPFEASDTAIVSIDGRRPVYMRWDNTFRIEPGRRAVVLSHLGRSDAGEGEIVLNATEGRTYVAKSDVIGMNIRFWIEDESGGTVARKEVPREPRSRTTPMPVIVPLPAR
ncbi:hypothetical protein [Luteolibacter marinus]|uniref:hypothetical protein n=1 Tax=Luteolibacter marinus TaxID=2776705 RepID=UPI0018668BA8|nr:hypothetical protein [Luteolibacter marinus]